jgi:Outer membrane cobalamin receptor protein
VTKNPVRKQQMGRKALWLGQVILAACFLLTGSTTGWAADDDADRLVITAQDIADMKVNRIADIFNQMPGVTAGTSSVGIHGSYKVKVFLDGTPLNDPTSATAVNWSHVAIENIERIEILRDSGGMRYGQDASGGVILITSKALDSSSKGLDSWSGNIKAYGGNQDTGHLDFNMGTRKGLWSLGFKGAYDRTESYGINNDKEKWQTGLKVSYNQSEKRFISLSADYLEDERGMSGLPDFPTPHFRQRKRNVPLGLTGRYDDWGNTLYYNGGLVENTDISRNLDTTLRVSELGDDLTYDIQTGDSGVLTLGTGFLYGQASSSEFDKQSEHSLYLLAAEKFKRGAWTLKVGARGNYNSAFENALNPEASVSYTGDRWNSTFSYSRATNTPSFQQRYNHTSSTIPNPSLGMETSDNYSQAFNFEPTDDVSLGLTFFYNNLTDRITYVRLGNSGVSQYQNVGRVTYKGGDLTANWRANEVLTFKISYTYLEAMDEDLNKLVTAKAKHKGDFEIYIKPFDGFSNVLKASYSSPVYTDRNNTNKLPAYTLFGFRSEYSFEKWNIFMEIENLFDKTYLYSDGILAPPRTWIIGVNRKI